MYGVPQTSGTPQHFELLRDLNSGPGSEGPHGSFQCVSGAREPLTVIVLRGFAHLSDEAGAVLQKHTH